MKLYIVEEDAALPPPTLRRPRETLDTYPWGRGFIVPGQLSFPILQGLKTPLCPVRIPIKLALIMAHEDSLSVGRWKKQTLFRVLRLGI